MIIIKPNTQEEHKETLQSIEDRVKLSQYNVPLFRDISHHKITDTERIAVWGDSDIRAIAHYAVLQSSSPKKKFAFLQEMFLIRNTYSDIEEYLKRTTDSIGCLKGIRSFEHNYGETALHELLPRAGTWFLRCHPTKPDFYDGVDCVQTPIQVTSNETLSRINYNHSKEAEPDLISSFMKIMSSFKYILPKH